MPDEAPVTRAVPREDRSREGSRAIGCYMTVVIYIAHDARHVSCQGRCRKEVRGQMRVSQEKAAENRERIVETASRMFREDGFDRVGVDAIMHGAGLTHGGFYGH